MILQTGGSTYTDLKYPRKLRFSFQDTEIAAKNSLSGVKNFDNFGLWKSGIVKIGIVENGVVLDDRIKSGRIVETPLPNYPDVPTKAIIRL